VTGDKLLALTPRPEDEPFSPRFDEQGLIPVVAQDVMTREVALLAYMNAAALDATLATGELTLWSRSRHALWRKGETSGHTLRVLELRVNCEGNSLLAQVELTGPGACHEGYRGCYYRALSGATAETLTARIVEPRAFDPAEVYTDARHDDAALERDARALYSAYERLREQPPDAGSPTAALLHAKDAQEISQQAASRAAEELDELRGVLAGVHRHHGDDRDVLLEASQVGYWAMVAAVALRLPYDAWQPHRAWLAGWHGVGAEAASQPLAAPLIAAGALCRAAGLHPARVIAADLVAMRDKHGGV